MIKTVGELRKLIENVPDDFELKVSILQEIEPNWTYSYPWVRTKGEISLQDIGWSDKVFALDIEERE